MAIPHAASGEVIDIRPYGINIGSAITKALFKSDQLEVIRMVLLAGKKLPEHQITGEITVQCIEGKIIFHALGSPRILTAGSWVHLPGEEPYAMEAMEDSSLLVTFHLQHGDASY